MTPAVLLVVYRRPEETARVFDAIAAARPQRLFVAADGPRNGVEAHACAASRAAATRVTWPCDVVTDFSERNVGCRTRMMSALSWFFSQVDEGVVLEDDCVPSPDFFRFCAAMLDRYRDDERIVHVSGETYQRARRTPYSYAFSKYPLTWGWASWRRTWRLFDPDMRTWPSFRASSDAAALWDTPDEAVYLTQAFQQMHDGAISTTWDYAWWYACMTQGLSIRPAANLVMNVGGGAGATHTGGDIGFLCRSFEPLDDPIRHPPWVVRDKAGDMDTFDLRLPGEAMRRQRTLAHHLRRPFRWLSRSLRG